MRINVSNLPPEGLELKDSLSLSSLNARMDEGRANDIRFSLAPTVSVRILNQGGGISVRGVIESEYHHPCPRCVEPISRGLKQPVDLFFKRHSHTPDTDQDDIGICYYDGLHIELEEYLQQELILAINPFEYLPSFCEGRDCSQGSASPAREDSSGTFSLLDKLKNAGIK